MKFKDNTSILIIMLLMILCSCGNNRNVTDYNKKQITFKDTIIDNLNNNNYQQSLEAWRGQQRTKIQKERTKVFYNDSIYSFDDFEQKISFNNSKFSSINILKDTLIIRTKYKINNCDNLIIIE